MMQFPAPGQAPRIEGAPGGLPGACAAPQKDAPTPSPLGEAWGSVYFAGAHIMRLLYWGAAHWGDRPLHGA